MRLLLFIFLISHCGLAQAQFIHERIRRVTVFPIKVEKSAEKDFEKASEDAWWKLREKMTESKRFLVASKNFMQAKDVFQPRGELQPADAIILGRLLDANALVNTYLVDRHLSMSIYDTKNGLTIWQGELDLHPAVQVSKQLSDATQKLMLDFISSIPYQGFVIVDSMVGRAVISEGEKRLIKVDVGEGTQVTVGDTIQLIRIKTDKLKPIFMGGSTVDVYGEGRVTLVDRHILTVQLVRLQDNEEVKADALIRIPDELRRLKEIYGIHEASDKNIDLEAINSVNQLRVQKESEIKPLVASLSWIGNFLAVLLLAF